MESKAPISFEDTSIAFSSKTDAALRKSLWLFGIMNHPWLVNLITNSVTIALKLGLPVKTLIRITVYELFCGGETIEECRETSLMLRKYGVGSILDYSVEGTELESDFDRHTKETLNTIRKAGTEPKNPFCVFKVSGIASNVLLEKLQQGIALTDEQQQAWDRVKNRMDRICKAAVEAEVRVMIDAEESWIQNPIDDYCDELMQRYNQQKAVVFNTYQMYRHDMLKNLREAFHRAVTHNYFLGAKLVRGAYMEKERERAQEMEYPSPIQPHKQATDDDFNAALKFCIDNNQRIDLCCGTHNEYSNYYLTVLMEKYNLKNGDPGVYFMQLYGMSDNISYNLAHNGYNVAKYVPYGPIKKVMPYLIRRAEENTAISGQTNYEYNLIKRELKRRKQEGK
ncbi:MAG: proline dehydrogenase family protein [Cyclobacteriaceae bacterium]|nr:proline dehydrogenase family protein [Cyclobacteriaceae bacterium]